MLFKEISKAAFTDILGHRKKNTSTIQFLNLRTIEYQGSGSRMMLRVEGPETVL